LGTLEKATHQINDNHDSRKIKRTSSCLSINLIKAKGFIKEFVSIDPSLPLPKPNNQVA